MRIPRRRADELKKQDNGPVYLTEDGFARLQGKLARIKHSLPQLIEATAEAAAAGDRSDNAAYTSSKAALRRANWQILEIEDELKRTSVITSGPDTTGAAKLGSVVILETDDGQRKKFEIVGPKETNPNVGRISQKSPLGAALIGKKAGDSVTIKTAGGPKEYRIAKIE
ncbi:MAG: GreA/GreB family elongation factor [Minisyncoccia bacterium]|jgi:transcription elongation GreA/GreB family factor